MAKAIATARAIVSSIVTSYTVTAIILALTTSCQPASESKPASAPTARPNHYAQNAESQMRILLYDPTGAGMGQTVGTYVDHDIVAAPLSAVRGAHSAKATTMSSRSVYTVYGYTAYDFGTDIVLLRVGKRNGDRSPLATEAPAAGDTLFAIEGTYEGKLFRHAATWQGNALRASADTPAGCGIFDNDGRLRAIAAADGSTVPAAKLDSLKSKQTMKHSSVYDLRLKTGRIYISHTRVAGFRIRTSMGEIRMRLHEDVPTYRDNFIRLVSDGYYDSLLVHRVLPNFLIQTGAADTKYAKPDDFVGWQGPGYTLPMETRPHHFHRRGAVAASKLPQERNSANRCDGGQFYIVSGRTFTDAELDKMEKERRAKFTPQQRQSYKTVGGAPHLDGDYVVFGEVTQGMDVVDKIAAQPVNGDRPVTDIRVYSIDMLLK